MTGRHVLVAAVVVVSLAATASPAAAATAPSFAVHLQADGDADVAVTYTFDLDSDAEQSAFREIRDNQSVRTAYAERFESRLADVAAGAANRTGREMAVENASVGVATDGETGVITVEVTWRGLAAVEGDRLVVTEPFASGFQPDRQFVLTLPDGYAASASPSPDSADGDRLAWNEGADLDGFEVTASPSSDGGDGGGGEDGSGEDGISGLAGPGFDVVVGVAALLASGLVARRGP